VVETGRRRRWPEDEKLKIVLESLQAPRQVAATARRYGISRSLLLRWRRSFRPEPTDTSVQPIGFAPAMVVPESGAAPGPVRSAGNVRNPMFNRRRQPSRGGTSRMTRECQVRFCEGLGVKFPGAYSANLDMPTRQWFDPTARPWLLRCVTPWEKCARILSLGRKY
jgi:hypothetical protein